MATGLDIVTAALREIGVLNATDPPSAEDADFALSKLNRLLDNWNADKQTVYASTLTTHTLTPGLAPHTIGPTGTFVVTQRPVSVDGANLVLTTSTPNVRTPIRVRDERWWLGVSVRALSTSVPTDLFYDPTWPNGELNLWPVPDTAYGLELLTRIVLAQMTLTTTFSLPPGYWDAITLTLAESLVGPMQVGMPATLKQDAAIARGRVFANNVTVPKITTQDYGMPGGRGTYMNWLTREIL